jgi:hypothetical protein
MGRHDGIGLARLAITKTHCMFNRPTIVFNPYLRVLPTVVSGLYELHL